METPKKKPEKAIPASETVIDAEFRVLSKDEPTPSDRSSPSAPEGQGSAPDRNATVTVVESKPRPKAPKSGSKKIAKQKAFCPACGTRPVERGFSIAIGPARVPTCSRCGGIANAALQVFGFLTRK